MALLRAPTAHVPAQATKKCIIRPGNSGASAVIATEKAICIN